MVSYLVIRNGSVHPGSVFAKYDCRVYPILYECVTLFAYTATSFIAAIEAHPPEFFATHVKSLCIANFVEPQDIVTTLSVCTGLTNFACWSTLRLTHAEGRAFADVLDILRPRKLSILFRLLNHSFRLPSFRLPVFHNVTRLHIRDAWLEWTSWPWDGIKDLPHLSHISFEMSRKPLLSDWPQAMYGIFNGILSTCDKLRVCLLLMDVTSDLSQFEWCAPEDIIKKLGGSDPRLVALLRPDYFKDWNACWKGEATIWDHAERKVQQQRQSS
jgi:hypothetical protein